MPLPLKPLTGTDWLGDNSHCGLQKQWPLKSKTDDALHWDYIQKVNYAAQDFNESISNKTSLTREDIVFAITLVDWINDAVEKMLGCYKDDTIAGFVFTQQDELGRMRKYFRAVRSFINAHPLGTDQHAAFEIDGTYVCIDIRSQNRLLAAFNLDFCRLTPDGLEHVDRLEETDIVLYAYSKSDGGMFFHHIGLDLADVRKVAELCIDKLNELDVYLERLKKKSYQNPES